MPKKFDWKFETFNDKTLINLLQTVKGFVESKQQAMFTLSGPSEIGKTHLLKKCFEYYKSIDLGWVNKEAGSALAIYKPWEELVSIVFESKSVDKFAECGILLIEDFLSENKNNSYTEAAYEVAYKIINRRVGKLTIIDTNKSIDDIFKIDQRIHSRMFREGGKFISIKKETIPYLTRCS